MLHRALLVAPPVVLLVYVAFVAAGSRQPMQFYTARVEQGDISQVVQATGTINAVTTVDVGSQVSGRIQEIFVDFNSQVTKGQVVATIDQSTFKTRVDQAEADLASARANIRNLEAQIDNQKADTQAQAANLLRARAQFREVELNLGRTEELFKQGIVAESQRDTVQASYEGAKAGVAVAEAQVEQSKARMKTILAQLDQAKAQVQQRQAAHQMARVDLGYTVISAPIDGTVIARNVDVGQTVAASLSAPTLFLIAQDLTKMQVYAKTDEADVGKIRPGTMATFRVDSFPRETFRGRVSQVRMNATMVQNVVTYDTIVDFDNPDKKLFPGMTAYITIIIDRAASVTKVPNGALRFRPEKTTDELNEIYARYNIPEAARRDPRAMMAGGRPGGQQGGPGGKAGAGGQRAGGANFGGGPGGGGDAGANRQRPRGGGEGGQGMIGTRGPREQWGIVWKLGVDKKELIPVAVKLGLTDFTFTELKEGELKPEDELVIGQSVTRANNSGQQRSPMGGMGPMRRM
ncbi:MAG TPA: efflux RND transporter periplasmic adaptor subunit [Candidatus Acidoferrales bacterium]